ncbi:unnamed protein product [Linum tenue]|uniref:KIB1-4 beta-propeller domain-containing protein n=1 Tax=Linum tenue TaxID=586396 RepID=A0AAV0JFS5_9ROSI|nr:unnamed protein product [Linum tenue]
MADQQDWSELTEDLLCTIGRRLITLQDLIRARAVCPSWRRALLAEQQRRFPSTQWLMLPHCTSKFMNRTAAAAMIGCKGSDNCRCFYDAAAQQFHHIEFPPGSHNRATCRGSAFGWLFMTGQTPCISLINPLTGAEIPLPPITSFPGVIAYRPEKVGLEYLLLADDGFTMAYGKKYIEKSYICKVAMSAEPTAAEDCTVMAIRFNDDYRLAICNPKAESWTLLSDRGIAFQDVVFWKGQFHILDFYARLMVCDLSVPHRPKLSLVLDLPYHRQITALDHYLVVCPAALGGGRERTYWTSEFRVFELNEEEGGGWDKVESIGDFALFLGSNTPAFVSTLDRPGLARNSIYFTDNLSECHSKNSSGHDMGIYDLATGAVQPLYCTASLHKNPLLISPWPVWFFPSSTTTVN